MGTPLFIVVRLIVKRAINSREIDGAATFSILIVSSYPLAILLSKIMTAVLETENYVFSITCTLLAALEKSSPLYIYGTNRYEINLVLRNYRFYFIELKLNVTL